MIGDNSKKLIYFCEECRAVFTVYKGSSIIKCPKCHGIRVGELVRNKGAVVTK